MKKTKTVQSYKNVSKQPGRMTDISEKTNFYDRTEVKKKNPRDLPKDGIASPWDFTCPQYDERSGNFVNAGAHFGVGHRVPVGHKDSTGAKQRVPCLPLTRHNTLQDDDLG